MKVYKFGGASVKDAQGVRRLDSIVRGLGDHGIVIVSAMGKMTNAFERLVKDFNQANLDSIKDFHFEILADLFQGDTHEKVRSNIDEIFDQLIMTYERFKDASYDFLYDQIVSFGEILSTRVVEAFLKEQGLEVEFLDARKLILTDDNYREAKLNWDETQASIKSVCQCPKIYISQGFIAGTSNGLVTTLGREGSDYSAAIFAYTLDAESLSIWKDVEGVLNADPRSFSSVTKLDSMSYSEALELAYYGASVIHPKTLKPLKEKNIPLLVKSFMNPESSGTLIQEGQSLNPTVPCYVLKKDQILVDIEAKDFSFITEDHLQEIYQLLSEFKIKVNLQQNSALRLSICLTDTFDLFNKFQESLSLNYDFRVERGLDLFTIRHKAQSSEDLVQSRGSLILKQDFNEVTQMVLRTKPV